MRFPEKGIIGTGVGFLLVTTVSMCGGGQTNRMAGRVGGPFFGEKATCAAERKKSRTLEESREGMREGMCVVVWDEEVKIYLYMKAEETKITGKILKVKEQKYRSYKKVAVLERRNISPRMGGKNGAGLPVEVRLAEAL